MSRSPRKPTACMSARTTWSVADARRLLGPNAIIGLSIKTPAQAAAAPLDLLDYVAIGGVYATTSKDNTSRPIGIEGLRAIAAAIRARKAGYPVCAIAGITAANAGDVIAAGADGVAVISALSQAADPAAAARALRGGRRGAETARAGMMLRPRRFGSAFPPGRDREGVVRPALIHRHTPLPEGEGTRSAMEKQGPA